MYMYIYMYMYMYMYMYIYECSRDSEKYSAAIFRSLTRA